MTKDSSKSSLIMIDSSNTILIDDKEIVSLPGESVLESLEREGIDVNFNCREGFCGVCRTKLISGKVEYKVDPLAFIEDDEILSCCTRPSSDIVIKILN